MKKLDGNIIRQLCKTYGCDVEGIRIFYIQRVLLNWETGEEDGYEYLYRVVIEDGDCDINGLSNFMGKLISDFDVEVSTVIDDSLDWVECEKPFFGIFIIKDIIMTPKVDKEVVFKLWDGMGVNSGPKILKYVGSRFDTWKEYYELLSEYYGIQGGVQGLKDSIIDYGNEYLSSIDEQCPGTGIRLYNVDIEKEMTSTRRMYDWVVNKMGTKPSFYYAYSIPTDWECSVDVSSDENDYYNEMECFDDECLMDPVRDVSRHIEEKYGIYGNVEMTFEGNIRGNIKIDKYEK